MIMFLESINAYLDQLNDLQVIVLFSSIIIAVLFITYLLYKWYKVGLKSKSDYMKLRQEMLELTADEEEVNKKLRKLSFFNVYSRALELAEDGDINLSKRMMKAIESEYSEDEIREYVYNSQEYNSNYKRTFTVMRRYGVPYAFRVKDIRDDESRD